MNIQTLLVVGIIFVVLLFALWRAAVQRGKDQTIQAASDAAKTQMKQAEKIDDQVQALPDDQLSAAADKWVRPTPKESSGK